MSSADVRGTFVWHELTTADPGAAGAFYTRVLGWKLQAWDKDPSYAFWSRSGGAVGGLARLPAGAPAGSAGAGWLGYVAVADVHATAASAERLGGRVVKPATELADGGRYAVLADPQSATIGVFSSSASGAGAAGPSGEFAWHELATEDSAAAFRFYQELFGWEQLGVHDLGAMGAYRLFGRHGRQFGGMFNRPPGSSGPPRWLLYVEVGNAAATAQAATAARGTVTSGPHQVPGGSWAAQLTDPQGSKFAVHQAHRGWAIASSSSAAAPADRPAAQAVSTPRASPGMPSPASKPSPPPSGPRPASPTAPQAVPK
ncbi:MAG: VOC family protein, partial [Steroidobacteraceae bacterium]